MAYAGIFNEPIEIYKFFTEKNKYGEDVTVREKVFSTRAKVGHIGGSRSVINNEIQVPYMKNFVVRIYAPVFDDSYIKYRGKFYRVESIDEDKEMQQKVVITQLVNE